MKKLSLLLCLVALIAGAAENRPRIQLALLLDTSNSMDGLIAQAKTQLWRIVNEFATAERDGQRPMLEVALFEYGNNGLPPGEGYVRQVCGLSDDLDRISEALFGLTTNGGSEYCGWVIRDAVGALAWSDDNRDLKAIYIAGNEPFTQGDVDYVDACRGAIGKSITVNTIFCGNWQEGIDTRWQHGAQLADGVYLNIDQDRAVARITAPQDARLAELNVRLNATYVAYGATGHLAKERQAKQDSLAATAAPAAAAQRAVAKGSSFYRNESWDIVDAVENNRVDVTRLEEKELPEAMRGMSDAGKQAYVADLQAKRAAIQAQIATLAAARKKYVAEQMKAQAADGEKSLDEALVESLQGQAKAKGFQFH